MKSNITITVCLLLAANVFAQYGVIDATFGNNGEVFTNINNSGTANAVAVQNDNKIIAVGTANFDSGAVFVAARYTADGALDETFGETGILLTRVGKWSGANCVAIQPDGKIVSAGKSLNASGNYDFAVVRHNTDGSIDADFGGKGMVTTDLGYDDEATAVNILPDGSILVAGFSRQGDSIFNAALVKYDADGNISRGFGRAGIVLTNVSVNPVYPAPLVKPDCKIQSDGKIVLVTTGFFESNDILVLRYNADGSADSTFGSNGRVGIDFGLSQDYGYAVGIQPDGKIIAAGASYSAAAKTGYMALARLNGDGSTDGSFGSASLVRSIGPSFGMADARSLIIQTDGNIIAAGSSSNPNSPSQQGFIIAKYQVNGALNTAFGTGGYTIASFSDEDSVATGNSIAMQAGGSLVMAGGNGMGFLLTRFLNAGNVVGAIKGNSIASGFQAFPNPTAGRVTVHYNITGDDNVTLRLWNTQGQMLNTILDNAYTPPGEQTQQVNLSSLPSGCYMLNLVTSHGQTTTTIMKE